MYEDHDNEELLESLLTLKTKKLNGKKELVERYKITVEEFEKKPLF